jgi:hypothetical protein
MDPLNKAHVKDDEPKLDSSSFTSISSMKERKYMKKAAHMEDTFNHFKEKALTRYEDFVAAITSKRIGIDVSTTSLEALAFRLLKLENLHEFFSFLHDHKNEAFCQATHANFPLWKKYDVSIQYTIDDEKKYDYGRLCLTPSGDLTQGAVHLFRETCANCMKIEKNTETGKTERFKKCSRCKKAYYCSVDCQKIHWKKHKVDCNESN